MIDIVVAAVGGLILTVVLWPTPGSGKRLLQRWEVPDPQPDQVEEAVRYLKRRRLLYPWLYVGLGLLSDWNDKSGRLVIIGVAGALLAELIALRPRRGARRVATLTPRGLSDVASMWVLSSYAVIVVVAATYLIVWRAWPQLAWLGLSVAAISVIIWAAVARPATGDERVDMSLRTRSVHVSAGLGSALAGVLCAHPLGLVGILAWIAMANTKPIIARIRG